MAGQQSDNERLQQLLPGLIGMSVHTDCVYLQEISRANPLNKVEPQVSSTRLVLHAINFEQLTSDLTGGRRKDAEAVIRQAVAAVQQAGANFLVVTANTISGMLEGLDDAVSVPVLDITRAVFSEAQELGLTRLGLLGTRQTVESGLYQESAAEFGCSIITPSAEIADAVNEAIFHRLIRGVCTDQDVQTVLGAVSWFESQGADSVILGCTDLTLLAGKLYPSPVPLLDSTVLHARAAYYAATTGDIDRYSMRRPAASMIPVPRPGFATR